MRVVRMDPVRARSHVRELAEVLVDCVRGGASVSFMEPFTQPDAEAFFNRVAEGVESGDRILLAAFEGDRLVGTVQVLTAMPPNQPHRGEIAKLLVRRDARGAGAGKALMVAAEDEARRSGKTLLTLDTASDSAERLYERLGWVRLGVIPDFALYPDGSPCDTTVFWKKI